MKQYKTTVLVVAEPKSLFDYIGNDSVDEDLTDNKDGFLVTGSGKSPVWMDTPTFEERYKCVDTFQDRLDIELDELTVKINALSEALNNELVPKEEIPILVNQLHVMNSYSDILVKRRNKLRANA